MDSLEKKEVLLDDQDPLKGLLDNAADVSVTIPLSELDCPICLKLIYDPITTPKCGHTACRECLVRTVQTKKSCPVCRTPIVGDPATFPTVAFIQHLLETYAPQQYKERRRETVSEKRQARPRYGCFISGYLHFPGQSVRLWIYEPRYRVMVNRALGTNKIFVLVRANQHRSWHWQQQQQQQPQDAANSPEGGPANNNNSNGGEAPLDPELQALLPPQPQFPIRDGDIGVLARITMCQATPDGRSLIEVVCTERVRLSNIEEAEDGFGLLTAECTTVHDIEDLTTEEEEEEQVQEQEQQPITAAVPGDTGYGLSLRSGVDGAADENAAVGHAPATADAAQMEEEKQQRRDHRAARAARMAQLKQQLMEQLQIWSRESVTPMDRLELWHGPVPSDPAMLSFWLCRALPGETAEKEAILASISSEHRLEMCLGLLENAIQSNRRASAMLRFFILAVFLLLCVMAFTRLSGENNGLGNYHPSSILPYIPDLGGALPRFDFIC